MKHILVIIVFTIFVSCGSGNRQPNSSNIIINDDCSEQFASLKLPEENSNSFFKQNDIRKRNVILPDSMRVLFENTEIFNQIKNSTCYIYDVINIRNNIHSMCVLSEGIENSGVYILNIDCDNQLIDYLYFEDCEYFDAYTPNNQNYEQAIFLSKYFKYPNDTLFVASHVKKEEKKEFEKTEVMERLIDSITYEYRINTNGKFDLFHKDSVHSLVNLRYFILMFSQGVITFIICNITSLF